MEEIVANKISYLSIKEQNKNRNAIKFENNSLAKRIINNLPFELTNDQQSAYTEICKSIALGSPMLRLLQGDVGSGKTIVAALIAAHIVADKKQVAILAPTTILANQHFQNFVDWFEGDEQIEILTSKISAKEKKARYERIKSVESVIAAKIQINRPMAAAYDEAQGGRHSTGIVDGRTCFKKDSEIDC